MSGSKIFSIEGKGLKLTTAEDIEPHIQELKNNDAIEEVKFLGNTLGIGASEALAKVLEEKKNLKVRSLFIYPGISRTRGLTNYVGRSPISPISSPLGYSLRSRLRCRTCLHLSLRSQTYIPSTSPIMHSD